MLNMSVANACIRGSLFDLDEPPSIPGRAEAVHTLQLHQLPLQTQDALKQPIAIEDAPEWSEAAVVQLHWVLLQELRKLTDPETPLEEKIETLDWALTSPSNDHLPFSFASCVRVVGTSPMSPTAYFGRVDVDELRQWLLVNARRWLRESIARYPQWAQELFYSDPHFAAAQLTANPQWLNEQIRRHEASTSSQAAQRDLFALASHIGDEVQEAACRSTDASRGAAADRLRALGHRREAGRASRGLRPGARAGRGRRNRGRRGRAVAAPAVCRGGSRAGLVAPGPHARPHGVLADPTWVGGPPRRNKPPSDVRRHRRTGDPVNHLNLSIRALPMQRLLPVRSLDELEHLVKESEVLTGAPGRTFVVAGADRPAYQVHADVAGFQIARLDGAMPHEVLATARELAGHPIGSAMACGLLYTEPLPQ